LLELQQPARREGFGIRGLDARGAKRPFVMLPAEVPGQYRGHCSGV
jgi:hypothetical protein